MSQTALDGGVSSGFGYLGRGLKWGPAFKNAVQALQAKQANIPYSQPNLLHCHTKRQMEINIFGVGRESQAM